MDMFLYLFLFVMTCTIAIPIALAARWVIELLMMVICLKFEWYDVVPFGKKVNLGLFILLFFPALILIFNVMPIAMDYCTSIIERTR